MFPLNVLCLCDVNEWLHTWNKREEELIYFTLEEKKKKCDAVTAHLEVDPTALVRTNYSQKMKF